MNNEKYILVLETIIIKVFGKEYLDDIKNLSEEKIDEYIKKINEEIM